MKHEFIERAALFRRSGDEVQAQRHEYLAAHCENAGSIESIAGQSPEALIATEVLFDLARQIDAEPTNAKPYLERARLYFDTSLEPGAVEWEQVERDLGKAIELGGRDDLLAEAYALRVLLRCYRGDGDSNFDDLKCAVQHGSDDPEVFEHLASLYCDYAKHDDAPEYLDEAISLYIVGIYYDLRHALQETNVGWHDEFGLLEGLATAYDQRAAVLRQRGKPVEAFQDEEKARWLRKEGREVLVEMNQHTFDIELPERIVADCPIL